MSEIKESCFLGTLRLIDKLQRNSDRQEKCDSTCRKPFLGNPGSEVCLNTRPVTFYRCDNTLISVDFIDSCVGSGNSGVFRIERIDGNCVTCTILAKRRHRNAGTDSELEAELDLVVCEEFVSTNQTAIISLDCVCALKCLEDTFIEL